MFHVTCRVDDLRNNGRGPNKQVQVQSGSFGRIYISVIDNDDNPLYEALVNAGELIQAINNATFNESKETRRKRSICRHCKM